MSETAERPQAANIVTSDTLADFQAQKLGLAADPAPAAEEKSNTLSEVAEQASSESGDAEPQDGTKKANPKIERRFSELTKQREAAKAEAQREREAREALEARLQAIEAQRQPAQAEPEMLQEPKPEQFRDMYEYARALAEYTAERKIQEIQYREIQARIEAQRQQVINTWAERVNQAKQELPDFDDMIESADVAVSDDVRDAIIESDVGPRILYYLAENSEFAHKLAGMSARQALKEIGKLEDRLSTKTEAAPAAPKVPKSKAPPPINPVRGGTAKESSYNAKDQFSGSFAEYKAARLAGRIR